MDPWIWAVCLLAVGLGLAVMEIFLPSGGILGFLSAIAILGAVVMAFRQGPFIGLLVLGGALISVPVVVALALQWWPHTPLGRRMMLRPPASAEVLPDSPRQRQLKALIGRVGQAKTKMLPSGAILIDGHSVDAITEGVPIDPGQRVRVIEVRANRVVVRPVDAETPSTDEANPLARPIDSISPDPFSDPPA